MRYLTLGLLLALNLSLVSSGWLGISEAVEPSAPRMEPLLKPDGFDGPPSTGMGPLYEPGDTRSKMGPSYEPNGLDKPSQTEMGPILEPGGIGDPPQPDFGPLYEPGGIGDPPQTDFGPIYEPGG
jgi:hypothetical protein